ncbi:MAG: glycosyltransferase [Actinobacteria bacterium]|nr:MAG: glycosyltransferase [Actinomycetota bacterium]
MRLLVVSASMGAGHDGAARELARRLDARGHEPVVVDFLDAMPLRIGPLLRVIYGWQLRSAPWSYEASYRLWAWVPALCLPLIALIGMLTGHRLRRWITREGAGLVISTYPLASLSLGRDRLRGKVRVPVATFVTDFAVHPLWTHPGIDLHLCVHSQSAEAAAHQAKGPATAPGPAVPPRFGESAGRRAEVRQAMGVSDDEGIVLLMAGSWGVGDLEATFDDVVATGRYTPLVVCGRNERLRRRLSAKGVGHVLGWTDDMPGLMAAADALVENAGGLTCMEAFAAGLPVVSFRPIAGHGKQNALEMDRAGVAALAPTVADLAPALDRATGPLGRSQVEAGRAMFVSDAAAEALRLVAPVEPAGVGASLAPADAGEQSGQTRPRRSPLVRGARRAGVGVAALSLTAATMYVGFTGGVSAATDRGIGVTHVSSGDGTSYVAVRLGEKVLEDPRLPAILAQDHVTAVVDGALAASDPRDVRALSGASVDVANGGWGQHRGIQWERASADVVKASRAIRAATGEQVHYFVPVRSVDGFDLVSARLINEHVVHPTGLTMHPTLPQLRAGAVYVIDARNGDLTQMQSGLDRLQQGLAGRHVTVEPLSALLH